MSSNRVIVPIYIPESIPVRLPQIDTQRASKRLSTGPRKIPSHSEKSMTALSNSTFNFLEVNFTSISYLVPIVCRVRIFCFETFVFILFLR